MRFADVAIEQDVDVALIAGDTFHSRRPPPKDLLSLTQVLGKLDKANIRTIIGPGNHDGMDAVGDERTHALAWLKAIEPSNVKVLTSPTRGKISIPKSHEYFNLVSTPYPHKRSFDAVMPDASPEDRIEAISRKYEEAVLAMREEIGDTDLPTIFLGICPWWVRRWAVR